MLEMQSSIPNGAWPVLFTPFNEEDKIDEECLDKLLEFYISTGQAGIFANSLSSEVFQLTPDERTRICRRLVKNSNGRIPIVAGGNFGETLTEQAEMMKAIRDTGVDAVVILLSALPEENHLVDQVLRLAEMVDGPLGVYECPYPDHRLLTADDLKKIAPTGRFVFMKETSREVPVYREKLAVTKGTPLRLFQANLRCSPESLDAGAPGVCGTFCNFCPEWSARLCDSSSNGETEERDRIFRSLLVVHDLLLGHGYPSSGKYLLQKRGLPISTHSRHPQITRFTDVDREFIDEILSEIDLVEPSVSKEKMEEVLERIGSVTLID